MNSKASLSVMSLALIFSGCASTYRSMGPGRTIFTNVSETHGIVFSYRYNVLRESGNKKFAKRELRERVHVVAVKIANQTDQSLQVGETLNFYINEFKAPILDPIAVRRSIKQSPYPYLLYLLLIPVQAPGGGKRTRTEVPTWEYAVGPGLAAINILTAVTANKRFLDELIKYNLAGKVIKPGEEVYGLMGFSYVGYDPLTLRVETK